MISQRIKTALLKRRPDTHKGDYGHIFVIAGSVGMTGAAYLASQAVLLSGAGLVTLGIPKSLSPVMARKLVEVMIKPLPETKQQSLSLKAFSEIKKFIENRRPDIIAIGPGLSQDKETQALVRKLIAGVNLPMVIDADGLNAIAVRLDLLQTRKDKRLTTIITPHTGEMARLLTTSIAAVEKDRKGIAKKFASDYNVIAVLKGNKTVVSGPKGRAYINRTGNAGMASGGCGDVLTGMIAGFLGQGIEPFAAAELGVYLHGLAGDLAAKEAGQASLKATDILEKIHKAIKKGLA